MGLYLIRSLRPWILTFQYFSFYILYASFLPYSEKDKRILSKQGPMGTLLLFVLEIIISIYFSSKRFFLRSLIVKMFVLSEKLSKKFSLLDIGEQLFMAMSSNDLCWRPWKLEQFFVGIGQVIEEV